MSLIKEYTLDQLVAKVDEMGEFLDMELLYRYRPPEVSIGIRFRTERTARAQGIRVRCQDLETAIKEAYLKLEEAQKAVRNN